MELHEGDETDFDVKAAIRRGWASIEDTDDVYVPVEASTSAPTINWEVEVVTAENPFPEVELSRETESAPVKTSSDAEPAAEKPKGKSKKS